MTVALNGCHRVALVGAEATHRFVLSTKGMTSRLREKPAALVASVAGFVLSAGLLAGCTFENTSESATLVDTSGAPSELWDSTVLHSISVSYDDADYDELIETYLTTGEKAWIHATVVIDGTTFEDVGLKLKGNSSLRGLSADPDAELSSEDPQALPWIINLSKYTDDQTFGGTAELVIRGNASDTSLNEAVALDLLEASGLAAEQAIAADVEINGESSLRLVIENPDDLWLEKEFPAATALYKAESGGDYSYRGADESAYDEIFDQEGGADDLAPLIAFLDFINNSDDATFTAELDQWLDVDAFATYLAFQQLVDNFDDIDGPGNNSYLAYDGDSGLMTVVSWDLNLAFGASPNGGEGGKGQLPGGDGPGVGQKPEGSGMPEGGAGDPTAGGSNILSERFLADETFAALVETETERLTGEFYSSGGADDTLSAWATMLTRDASELVSDAAVASDAASIADSFPAGD